ncbi:predicted protein [Botrytis cinerea T4]|uniref:Uncharacterized protein n=1 Tax=Botryotinia fuckeliana (strain T4) TaxID=999810 RepID=G2YWX8_BOTF4|nr:predicted protein [Botrytis cinerea T4]
MCSQAHPQEYHKQIPVGKSTLITDLIRQTTHEISVLGGLQVDPRIPQINPSGEKHIYPSYGPQKITHETTHEISVLGGLPANPRIPQINPSGEKHVDYGPHTTKLPTRFQFSEGSQQIQE